MEWILRNPQIHSIFGNLGFSNGTGYNVNKNCNAALKTILHNILTEDKYLRTFRRSISFGQNINKDLIPLLIHTKEDKTIELLIRILVNLTIPIECLLSVDVISKTDFGRHTIFEINNLLASTKAAFTDYKVTKVIIDCLKKSLENEQQSELSMENCTNISNCLLLLRNILHIPVESSNQCPDYNGSPHAMQNQILWNIFSQSLDKILIKLMSVPEAAHWGVTMVQLIALLYKDQHAVTLHKLLNLWLEASLSESSEDNESNTSPPDRGSDDSSPILTSDPTSDSSDTGGSGKSNDDLNSVNNGWEASSVNNPSENGNQVFQPPQEVLKKSEKINKSDPMECDTEESIKMDDDKDLSCNSNQYSERNTNICTNEKKTVVSENSDCGYGTQLENQESISTSSNEDELPAKKPVHQKPYNPKQRANNKARVNISVLDRKRKKIVKRGKTNIVNVQGLSHKTPTDDDISNIMKEFTVDFLLKGYNSLVQTLHTQILTNPQLEIDTSHFFWLVTYFLKFATQIELDLEHVSSVLSYDIISYLTAEGVNLCEQFELAIKLDGTDLKPSIRRLHLVVTAIREFVQAIDVYKKIPHIGNDERNSLFMLQLKMCETEELRSLLVLLLRHFNTKYHAKQYLQDLVVTNHILLIFLDSIMKLPDYNGSNKLVDHIKQFATPEIMFQYGLLLEDYVGNGEFVNDCIFTLMHHVGGELECLISLFQPKILKTFTSIWKSEFEICDDWSDLIEYVINTFIKKPHTLQSPADICLDFEDFQDEKEVIKSDLVVSSSTVLQTRNDIEEESSKSVSPPNVSETNSAKHVWTEDEISCLNWNYMQCSSSSDYVSEIIKLLKEGGINKTRQSVLLELYNQNLITKEEYESSTKSETNKSCKSTQPVKDTRDDEIAKLSEQLTQDGKSKFLYWVQRVLLETCFAKLCLDKKLSDIKTLSENKDLKILNFEIFKKKANDFPVISPISCQSLMYNQSVPLIPWNCEQASICKDLKFLQLLHKLGFHMPVDTGKVFIRIPHFWTADILYEIAGKVAHIDTSKLKFPVSEISENSLANSLNPESYMMDQDLRKDITMMTAPENFYQIHKQSHISTMVNFTPMPGSSFNSENCELQQQNWLELVQKSQECKLALHIRRSTSQEECQMDEDDESRIPSPLPPLPSLTPLLLPVGDGVKHETPRYADHIPDSQFYNRRVSLDLRIIKNSFTNGKLHRVMRGYLRGQRWNALMYIKCERSRWEQLVIFFCRIQDSLCETASVASDLTRMYVSDEDDKPDVIIIQPIQNDMMIVDDVSADLDAAILGKRPI